MTASLVPVGEDTDECREAARDSGVMRAALAAVMLVAECSAESCNRVGVGPAEAPLRG